RPGLRLPGPAPCHDRPGRHHPRAAGDGDVAGDRVAAGRPGGRRRRARLPPARRPPPRTGRALDSGKADDVTMTIMRGIEARGTHHCETTALGVLLRHEGLDLSEPMLFGLGGGLSFVYWDSKSMPFPFLGGRVKPFELTRNLAARLGLTLTVKETTSPRKAWENVATPIDAGKPVGLQLDSYHLDYFGSKVHFGGHVVAMYGYDEQHAYLVDTAQQGGAVRTTLDSLARARAERGPMTARHRSFTLTLPANPLPWQDQLRPAIRDCAETFLAAPIANLGHRGIAKAARLVPGWLDRTADLAQVAMLME